jgi:hypothetical protein
VGWVGGGWQGKAWVDAYRGVWAGGFRFGQALPAGALLQLHEIMRTLSLLPHRLRRHLSDPGALQEGRLCEAILLLGWWVRLTACKSPAPFAATRRG